MRLALVTYALNVGGVETFLRHLADFFTNRGDVVEFVETHAAGVWSRSFSTAGYTVRQVLPRRSRSRLHHVRRIAAALGGFDAIVLNDAPWAQAGLGLLPPRTATIPILHLALLSMVRNAAGNGGEWDVMAAVSPATRAAALDAGVPAERVRCIPNGVPVPAVWPKGRERAASALRAIYVGSLDDAQKGVLLLPAIFGQLRDAGRTLHVDVVGDGPDRAALAAAFEREKLGASVTLHGAVPHERTQALLAQADVLLMPSRFEGLPLVLLEAVACGVVPVATRIPGSTDFVVDNGVNGYLAAPGDAAGFARAIAEMDADRACLRALSLRAWETARDRFTSRANGQAYAELLDGIIGSRPQRRRSGEVDRSLLGDWPGLPLALVRPVRKVARMLGTP